MNMFSGQPRREPSADQRQMAGYLHSYYIAYVEAGFTKQQALEIVLKILSMGVAANTEQKREQQ